MKHVIGLDIGGTNIKAVVLDEVGHISQEVRIPTADDGSGHWVSNVKQAVTLAKQQFGDYISAVGIAAPGLSNKDNTYIAHLPGRLFGLEKFDWSAYLGYETWVVNDAHAATMAEKYYGAATQFDSFILLTLGTGVGGGVFINGQLIQGLSQMAGHLGHTLVNDADSEKSILGMPGSLEYAIGNYSVAKRSNDMYKSTNELVAAFQQHDYFASYIWLNSLRQLALALSSMINMLSPEAIVLAGGISKAGDSLMKPLNSFLDVYEFRPDGKKTQILQAVFDDLAGAIGAGAFAMNKIKN